MWNATQFARIPTHLSTNSSPDSDATDVQATLFEACPGTAKLPLRRKSTLNRKKRRISEAASTAWTRAKSRFMRENKHDPRMREK